MIFVLAVRAKNLRSAMALMTNRFIAFEGIDGCGKTTQIEALHKVIEEKGFEVVRIREPGGTSFSEEVRELLLKPRSGGLSEMAELLLFNAARAQLIREVIAPALKEGKVVLADRFALSTLAYQGYGRQMNLSLIEHLLKEVCGDCWPAKTFYLDISSEESLKRRALRGGEPDRLELEKGAFFDRVVAGYREISLNDPKLISRYNALETIDTIHSQIVSEAFELLFQNPKD